MSNNDPVQPKGSGIGKVDLMEIMARAEGLKAAGKVEEGIAVYKDWLEDTLSPLRFVAWFNLGASLSSVGRKPEALLAYQEALVLKPDFGEAHVNLGLMLEDQGKVEEALAQWRQVCEVPHISNSTSPAMVCAALNHVGRRLELGHDYEPAEEALARSLALDPAQPGVLQHWVHLRQKQCKWPAYGDLPRVSKCDMLMATSPLAMLAEVDDPTRQLLSAYSFVQRKLQVPEGHLCQGKKYNHKRLRIGYLSSDLCTHAVGMLLPEVFENHDRSRVETYGFCVSKEDGSGLRQRLVTALEHFETVGHLSDEQVARRIVECEIDVLVDLNGLSSGTRVTVLALRPAPVQVTWLGFIGTTSLPYVDYVIADRFSLPDELTPFFREKPLYLPHSFLPKDSKREIGAAPTRAQYKLPEDKFVFASFNNIYKLNPRMYDTWLQILQRVPNSVLWLLDDNRWATENLTEFAKTRGVDPSRLIFTCRVMPLDHLARLPLADLFLDNHPYNAGSTASDVLWMKVPMLTLSGKTFVSRMGGGLLSSLGLPELITYSHEEYENRAVELALNPERIRGLRARLAAAISDPSRNSARQFAQNLEEALWNASGCELPLAASTASVELSSAKKSLLVRGWRDINHCYSLVNQFQLLELLKDPSLQLLHEDLPYAVSSWSPAINPTGFDHKTAQQLATIPPFRGQMVDAVYNISLPVSFYQGPAKKVVTFIAADFGIEGKYFAQGTPPPAAFTQDRNWVVTPSNWSKKKLVEAGLNAERVSVVPHGVDTDLFRPLVQEEWDHVRTQVGASPETFLFLNVGGAFWNNGGDLLLRAFAELHRKYPSIKLLLKDNRTLFGRTTDEIISGLSAKYPGLFTEEVLRAVVLLPAAMSPEQLRSLYGVADLYVSPYRAKKFNLPALEAMACGCKILVTEGGATEDYYYSEVCTRIKSKLTASGTIVETGGYYLEPEFDDLKAKMKAAIEASRSRPGTCSAKLQEFLKGWTWKAAAERLSEQLFEGLDQ